MLNLFKLKFLFLTITMFLCVELLAQYTYTRFSIDVNAGPSLPKTSIPGSVSGFGEIGFKGTLSRYLSLRASGGYGTATGSRDVTQMQGKPETVINYTKYSTTYSYITASAHLNLETLLRLRRNQRSFHRLSPYLVIGSGLMFPDIKVNRFDGQTKHYTKDLRFVTHNFGLDFKQFLSNRFDLSFGAEYRIVQSYYLDGAFSDKKLDGLINVHVGLSYNIGASADKKHMDWHNLDGQTDVIFAPEEEKKQPEPISEIKPTDSTVTAIADEPVASPEDTDSSVASGSISPEIAKDILTVKDTTIASPQPKSVVAQHTPKKVGRHVDIRPDPTQPPVIAEQPRQPATNTQPKSTSEPVTSPVTITPDAQASGPLNSISGIVKPLGKYNVIVGTYSGSRYAYLFRDKLRKQGFEAALFKSSDHSRMVRVAVYYGDDKAEALKQLRLYKNKISPQAWIHIYNPQ